MEKWKKIKTTFENFLNFFYFKVYRSYESFIGAVYFEIKKIFLIFFISKYTAPMNDSSIFV